MDHANHLIDDHIDGELAGNDVQQLGDWLCAGDNHVREFASRWLIHSLIHDYMSQRQVQADALLRALATRDPSFTIPTAAKPLAESTVTRGGTMSHVGKRTTDRLIRVRSVIGVVASMLLIFTIATLGYLARRP